MRETIFLAVCNALGVDYKEAATTIGAPRNHFK